MTAAPVFVRLQRYWFVCLLLVGSYLILRGLDHVDFWCDEAYVATAARDLLSTGKFTAWDGRNLNGFRNGAAVNNRLQPVNAPLDIFVCAGAFKLLGQSTFTARLPFALAGILSLLLFRLLLRLEISNLVFTRIAFVMLTFSTAYLLYLRQARYYSFAIDGVLLTLIGYRLIMLGRKRTGAVTMAAGGALAFYANPMVIAIFAAALLATHFGFYRWRRTRQRLLAFAGAGWLTAMLTIPYAIYYEVWFRPDHNFENEPWMISKVHLLWWNLRDLTWTSTLPYLIYPALAFAIYTSRHLRWGLPRHARFWLVLCSVYLLLLTIVSPQPTLHPWPADVRYQSPIYPVLALLAAYGIYWVYQRSRFLAAAWAALALTLTPWTFHPFRPGFQLLLPAYMREIHTRYPTVTSEITEYLRHNSSHDDTLFSTPEYMSYVVNFMLDDRLLLAGVLNSKTHLNNEVVETLPDYLKYEKVRPKWLVVYGLSERTLKDTELYLRPKDAAGNALPNSYELVSKVNLAFGQPQRPELTDHLFQPRTATTDDERTFVFRNVKQDDGFQNQNVR